MRAQRTKMPGGLAAAEQFFTLSLDLVCIAGTDGYFKRLNPAFTSVLGYGTDELLARPFIEFVHPEDVAATLAEVDKLARGADVLDFQNRYRCKDGSYKWLSWRTRATADGTLYAIARDITGQRHLLDTLHQRELEARVANRTKSMFLAAMSHEIRTPLIGVLGMLEILGRSGLDPEQRRQFNIVQQSARSLLEIIGDILDYSKIEAGKAELAPEPFAVRDLVSRVVSTFSGNAESKGLRLTQAVAPEVAPAHVGDSGRIRQVLANLVGNAVKFTERGSVAVSVRVTAEGDGAQHLSFAVSDTGIGISPEQMARLFQPFAQSDAGTTRRFGGTGLGLVICDRLAALMGGAVSAESEPGRGTTMRLELRLPVADAAAVAPVAASGDEHVATRRRPERGRAIEEGSLLLLAEDQPLNRQVLVQQLDLAGFLVDTAETGTLALEKFGTGIYGLILTDLHMPGLDGFELTAAIRTFEAQRGMRRTPIIALTANVMRADVERCFACGMDDYLSKPVTIRQLTEKLRQWLPGLTWDEPPARQPQFGEEAVIEDSLLYRATGGNEAKVAELLRFYCRTLDQDLADLEAARHEGNSAVGRVAHRMRGAALMVGAHAVVDILRRIESSVAGAGQADIGRLAEELRHAAERVREYVESH